MFPLSSILRPFRISHTDNPEFGIYRIDKTQTKKYVVIWLTAYSAANPYITLWGKKDSDFQLIIPTFHKPKENITKHLKVTEQVYLGMWNSKEVLCPCEMLGHGGPTCSSNLLLFKVRFSILYVEEKRHFCLFLSWIILNGRAGRNYDKRSFSVYQIFSGKKKKRTFQLAKNVSV